MFGSVTNGMDVVKAIEATKTDDRNDKPIEPVVMESVTVSTAAA